MSSTLYTKSIIAALASKSSVSIVPYTKSVASCIISGVIITSSVGTKLSSISIVLDDISITGFPSYYPEISLESCSILIWIEFISPGINIFVNSESFLGLRKAFNANSSI
jgi:hypothetical protein